MNNHELTLLGRLVIDEKSFYEYRHLLHEKLFKSDLNAKAFLEIKRLREEGKDINLYTYKGEISLDKLYLVDLSADIQWIIGTLNHEYVSNEVTKLFVKANQKLLESDATDEVLDELRGSLSELITGSTDVVNPISHNIFELLKYINSPSIAGFNSGIRELDELGGFQKSDLVILAGRTSQGKTSFALALLKNIGLSGKKTAIISLEMSALQLTTRLVSMHRGISSKNLMIKKLSEHDRFELGNLRDLQEALIYLDDKPQTNLSYIISRIRTYALQYQVEVVFIDYLQLITNPQKGQSREQEVGNTARALKNLAKELNICIVCLSQLSRTKDAAQEPRLSELRDSGQIEEAADVVMLIYRPEAYGLTTFEDGESCVGRAEITIAKGRNIGTGVFRTNFNSAQTRFTNEREVF
jgi:replicative DNA helicase